MSFSSWLRSLRSPRARTGGQTRQQAPRRRGPRLSVEQLEDRLVPSTFVFQTIDNPNAGRTGDGTQGTFAIGINASGRISGNYGDSNDVTHGFLLSHGHYTTFDDPNAGSAAGQGTNASGLNDRGQIVGFYWDANSLVHGFLLSHGQYTTLDDPNAALYTAAVALNNREQIVGYYADTRSVIHGFLLSHGQYTTLDDPNAGTAAGQGTSGLGINNDGQVSGNYVDAGGVNHGFLLSHGQYTTLDDPNAGTAAGQGTVAYGLNDRGQIVGYYADAGSVFHGFLLSHGQYTTLDDPNAAAGAFQGTVPVGISASGKIVGSYIDSNNLDHGFLATSAKRDSGAAINLPGGSRLNSDSGNLNMPVGVSGSQTNIGNGFGGALYVGGGTVTLTGDTLSTNTAQSGGALYVAGGTVTLTSDTLAAGQDGRSVGSPVKSGEDGGLSINAAAAVSLDAVTLADVINNTAFTRDNDIFGPFAINS
jgi:hypothetical protein